MPRTARSCPGGYTYHVLNRGNARATVFHKPEDYDAFLDLMAEAAVRRPMRILAYCLMPNHFHLALWPREDSELSRWMHWLMTAHVRRDLRHSRSSGHVWQGRFKAFPIQEDEHLLTVLRYIERNPLRAGLVERAEAWRWSSLPWLGAPERAPVRLEAGTVPRGSLWVEGVNATTPDIEAEAERVRGSIRRDRPYGTDGWIRATARELGLEYSLRPRGRPRRDCLDSPDSVNI
jgi:putative transposase